MLKEGDGLALSEAGSVTAVKIRNSAANPPRPHEKNTENTEEISTEEIYFALKSEIVKTNIGFTNAAPQVRPEIKAEPLSDLKASIANDGLDSPPMYALLNTDELQEYLDLVNKTWSTNAAVEDFRPCGTDQYLVIVFGHRRTRAFQEIAAETGKELDRTYADAQVLHHPSTHVILSKQLSEGIMIPPPPEREAALIEQTYRTGLAIGRYESMADFERKSPMGETKISNALHFMQLPESIRRLVADEDSNELNYTRAVLLRRIVEPYSAYLRRHPKLTPHLKLADYDVPSNAQIERAVEEKMHRILSSAPLERPWRTDSLKKHVRGLCESWTSEIAEDALTMFDSAAERDRDARERAEVKEIVAVLSGAAQFARKTARIAIALPERVRSKTTKQQRRVAEALSKLSVIAAEASDTINAQLLEE